MRADRLLATLLLLQAKGRVTAAQVAEELEVSERTARRDLEALALAGVPVYSQPGRGGGWSLVGGARTDLTGLSAEEATGLFLAAGPSASGAPELRAALRKLLQALPAGFREAAEVAATSVVVEPAGWGRSAPPRPPALAGLQAAVVARRRVHLGYRSRSRGPSERVVDPLGLVAKGPSWYLVAGTDDGLRTFRVDRVATVEALDDPVRRPPGFDLVAAWREIASGIDGFRSRSRARARVAPGWIGLVRAVVGERLTVFGQGPDGWTDVEVGGGSPREVAAMVAGFGTAVRVVAPDEVRAELGRLGADLVRLYPDAGAGS